MPRCRFRVMPLLVLFACVPALAEPAPLPVRLGVFDPEVVWKTTEVGKRYNQDLTDARDRLQAGIDKKQQEIDAMVDKLRQQQASLSDDKAQQMQKDIQNKRVELNRMNEDATAEMKNQLNDVQGRFQKMLGDVLEAYGREKNFALILNKAVVDYSSSGVDVTQELIAKFNELNKAPAGSAAKVPPKKPAEKPKETPHN
jgi:Skp family chaperone for outer membrane proteins